MTRITTLLLATMLLAACGGDEQEVTFPGDGGSLVYAYPYDGQAQVPVHAPLVLRFSDAVTSADPAAEIELETGAGDDVPVTVESAAGDHSLVIRPDEPLSPATDFVLQLGAFASAKGSMDVPEDEIAFSTRPDADGAGVASRTDTDFRVKRMIPDGGPLPLMDFSTLRLQFTQPIERDTLEYGDSVRLEDGAGALVEASVIAGDHYLTVDPAGELDPDQDYRLQLTSDLESVTGNALNPQSYADRAIHPQDSRPRETLVQKAPVSNDAPAEQCGPDTSGDRLSPLTGMPINCVPVNAVLLGEDNYSQQQGDVHAELAYIPDFPDVTPLRVPRGSLLQGSSVEVNIAGEVPAGFDTGDISVKFISDATGFLMPNPYSSDPSAPRRVRLYMDVAMNAENAQANGALSQDLLHLELVGTSIVEDGTMVINAVGVVEPEVLGLEDAHGTLSFRMESYRDQDNAPIRQPDTTNPELQSWMPGDDGAGDMRPGDPIIVNFSEPLDRNSLAQSGAVTLNGGEAFDWYLDGASLVIHPEGGLEYGASYDLQLTGDVTDLAGNPLLDDHNLQFEMPHYVGSEHRSPLAITTYPGYPCVTTDRDLANDNHGRCAGGDGNDDNLPVMDLPANRPIVVQFSQTMAKSSISLDGSFTVERSTRPNDPQDGSWDPVEGRLEVEERLVRFHPEKPWEDEDLYRYTLGSNGDGQDSQANCDGTDAICSRPPDGSKGLPLQTSMLGQCPPDGSCSNPAPIPTGGGPDMEIHFHGAPPTDAVLQTLRNLPTVDVNANMVHDGRTVDDDESTCTPSSCEAELEQDGGGNYLVEENATRIIATGVGGSLGQSAKTGCDSETTCPENKFAWLTGGLNAEVVGLGTYTDPDTGESESAVRVHIFPTMLIASNLDVYANIGSDVHTPSGPQIMRMRYDGSGSDAEPITAWILERSEGPILRVEQDLYLDAPYLSPVLDLGHNLHSYEITMSLEGPVTFLEDGRMQIQQRNAQDVPINVDIGPEVDGEHVVTVNLSIPEAPEVAEDGLFLNFAPTPIKE